MRRQATDECLGAIEQVREGWSADRQLLPPVITEHLAG